LEVSVEFENMTLAEIQQHLAEIEEQRVLALQALKQAQEQAKYELAQVIKDMIEERGYTLDDILPLLTAKRRRSYSRRKSTAESAPMVSSTPQGAYYVDPENDANIYVKGAIPGWLKQKMVEQGLDPKSKTDRNTFKGNYLRRVEG
jgi:DNA-binding protein H-NS